MPSAVPASQAQVRLKAAEQRLAATAAEKDATIADLQDQVGLVDNWLGWSITFLLADQIRLTSSGVWQIWRYFRCSWCSPPGAMHA